MQIAQVVPKTRTQKEAIFDYAIPPEILPQVKIGCLVEIPFHGRKLSGIVINLKRSSTLGKLLPINAVIDPNPVVDKAHIKLSQWMADYYATSLGKTLFENVVPLAKRIFKKQLFFKNVQQAKKYNDKPENKTQSVKKYLVMANFQERMKFYLAAIEKTLKQKKQVIIIVPDLNIVPFFTNYLRNSVVVLHSGLTHTQRSIQWNKIRAGEAQIVIGSTSALFSPLPNLGLIIIDQEESETYKNDRAPRFHLVKVAEKLSQLTVANLVLGSIAPRIETYYQALKNVYILKKPAQKNQKFLNTIVDMNSEKQILSLPLQKEIEEQIVKKQKVLLIFNRKGEGRNFSCIDCRWTLQCPFCQLPLTPQDKEAICYHCEKTFSFPEKCPKCDSVHLKSFGLGTKKLEKFVHDFFKQEKTIRIEEGSILNPNSPNWDIAIATSYALKFNFPKIGLVAIIDADQSLSFPDFRSFEKSFQVFYKFLKIGERGIIQTHLPENYFISTLAKMDYEKFFLEELSTREKYNLPPFGQLIRLLSKNNDNTEAKKEAQRISLSLKEKYGKEKFLEFLGPSPVFLKKQRGKFIWQIIIKIKPVQNQKILDELKNFLKKIDKNTIVNVDPISLL